MTAAVPAKRRDGRRIVLPALICVQVLALIRNTLMARLLGPEQFGLAVTFLLAQQFIEMSTDTGLSKFVLQSRFGNRASIQATVQALAATRGTVIALAIVGIAWPVFSLLGLDHEITPFLILACASLAMGFLHYDNARQQRNNVFVNDSFSNVVGETCGLLACLLMLVFTRTYLVVIVGIMVRSMAVSLMSHLMANRRYRLRYSRHLAAAVLTYSWPLLVNGPLLFFSTQFDRIFVSALLGLRELGIYSAALLLLVLPMGLLTRVLGTIFIPRLAAAHNSRSIDAAETEFTGLCLTAAIVAACGFTAVGPMALVVLYGPAYAQAVLPVSLIGLAQAVRFLRTWPSGLAIAVAQTGNVLLSTVVRLLALPFGLAGILFGEGISGLAGGLLLGETLALVVSLVMLNRGRGLPLSHGMAPVGVAVAVATVLPIALILTHATVPLAAGLAVGVLMVALIALHRIDRRMIPRNLSAFGW
jgi:O-antigen/teichoic acid export membrane protein